MTPTATPDAVITCPSILLEASHDPCDGWTYTATASLEINVKISSSVEASIAAGPTQRPQDALADLVALCAAAAVTFVDRRPRRPGRPAESDRPTRLWWHAYPQGTRPDGIDDFVTTTAASNGWETE